MREYLFRGKSVDNGEWVYGYAVKGCDKDNQMLIAKSIGLGFFTGGIRAKEVIPETVGQYVGLTDKNGKKIFEGDIVKENDIYHRGELQIKGNTWRVVFADGLFFGNFKDISVYLQSLDGMEVTGNIHDNKELLESYND